MTHWLDANQQDNERVQRMREFARGVRMFRTQRTQDQLKFSEAVFAAGPDVGHALRMQAPHGKVFRR
jgi:hypothetical protein